MAFTYVHVPADVGQPLEELTATHVTPGEDTLLTLLRPRFSGGRIVNADSLRAEFGDQVDARMGALNAAAQAGTVEVFALCRPSKSTIPTPHQGTYLYFDEMGTLKGLPVNPRAMSIAQQCGLDVESPFHGDCFIGRVTVEPPPLEQSSFSIADLNPDSEWIKSAPAENHMYDAAMKKYEAAAIAQRKAPDAKTKADAKVRDEQQGAAQGWDWEESSEDVEVTLTVEPGTSARNLAVDIKSQSVRVVRKDDGGTLLELALYARVQPAECSWTLDGRQLQLTLEKVEESTWGRLQAPA